MEPTPGDEIARNAARMNTHDLVREHNEKRNRHEAGRPRGDHRTWFANELSNLVQKALKLPVPTLLQELALEWGISWSDVARMVGVSVPALRKWRTVGAPAGDNHRKLAELASFMRMLKKTGVQEPASWISVPLVSGYTVTPRHLYCRQSLPALLDLASASTDPETILDELHPSWREDFSSAVEVVVAEDGKLALVDRTPSSGAGAPPAARA